MASAKRLIEACTGSQRLFNAGGSGINLAGCIEEAPMAMVASGARKAPRDFIL